MLQTLATHFIGYLEFNTEFLRLSNQASNVVVLQWSISQVASYREILKMGK